MSLFPPAASSNAPEVDLLLTALIGGTVLVLLLVFGLMTLYCVRYRHDSGADRGNLADRTFRFEIAWTAATLAIFFGRRARCASPSPASSGCGRPSTWAANRRSTRCTCR